MNRRDVFSCLAVVCIGCLCAVTAMAAPQDPLFVKFQFSDQGCVYAKVLGDQLRLAPTAEGLDKAKMVKGVKDTRSMPAVMQFKEVELPLDAAALPEGYGPVKVVLSVYQTRDLKSFLKLQLRVSKKDEKKVMWSCEATMTAQAGDTVEGAQAIAVPLLEQGELEVVAKPKTHEAGIAVRVKAGQAQLSSIRSSGREVDATLKIMDSNGREVSSARGPLSKFGLG